MLCSCIEFGMSKPTDCRGFPVTVTKEFLVLTLTRLLTSLSIEDISFIKLGWFSSPCSLSGADVASVGNFSEFRRVCRSPLSSVALRLGPHNPQRIKSLIHISIVPNQPL